MAWAREQARLETEILEKLQQKLNVSWQKAQEYFQKYAAETV